ncbi:MAG: cytidine deaminase [Candidatus Nanohalobium sp.]
MNQDDRTKLVEKAEEAMQNSYRPDRGTKVGAAVMTPEGKVFGGCVVKTANEGMGTCAERCAIYNAVAHGEQFFTAVAITSEKDTFFKPCGMCMQLLNEFAQHREENDMDIVMANGGETETVKLHDLIPETYGPEQKYEDPKYGTD